MHDNRSTGLRLLLWTLPGAHSSFPGIPLSGRRAGSRRRAAAHAHGRQLRAGRGGHARGAHGLLAAPGAAPRFGWVLTCAPVWRCSCLPSVAARVVDSRLDLRPACCSPPACCARFDSRSLGLLGFPPTKTQPQAWARTPPSSCCSRRRSRGRERCAGFEWPAGQWLSLRSKVGSVLGLSGARLRKRATPGLPPNEGCEWPAGSGSARLLAGSAWAQRGLAACGVLQALCPDGACGPNGC
jgi:hypothetical protein